ncbi:MAG: hypothetical protein Fur0046_31620 [Cyanobacteria bacterium J069]|nr:MAG: hypothetical protein D6742_05900 [Cyanobacteria bacterium J069]
MVGLGLAAKSLAVLDWAVLDWAVLAIAAYPADTELLSTISFDLTQISPEGWVGSADGRRSLRYEFCIPHSADYQVAVQAIDPTIEFYPHSPGRIGCRTD